jgi:outer membrane protein assembly factor BamA
VCHSVASDDEPKLAFRLGDNWRVTPYIAPGYTPEMGALLAAGGLFSFKTSMSDTVIKRSSITLAVAYSTKSALTASVVFTSFWKEDRLRVPIDLWYKSMPDHYFGVGYDACRNTEQDDSTTAYDRTWFWFNPRFLLKMRGDLYGGLDWDINYTRAENPGPVMLADPTFQYTGTESFNHGLGAMVQYDSRDVPVNAWRGTYVSARARFYGSALGSDNNYQIYDFDVRHYLPLRKIGGSTLAWQLRMRIGTGTVPWAELSQPGTPFDLRGYRWGRYRDKSMFFGLLEYRHMFVRSGGRVGPHGVVGWVGTGSVAPLVREFRGWLPNFGVGYRLEVQTRMSVRLDIGFGETEGSLKPGLYFNFNEAF